jgi:delta 1-pyrroline-5-carboxylate dehydrogenase
VEYIQRIKRSLNKAQKNFRGKLYLNRNAQARLLVHPFGGFNMSGTWVQQAA